MSFALTTDQVKEKTKTVTRRKGWLNLKPGDKIQPVVKCMGLRKGEKQELIGGPIEVVSVDREPIGMIDRNDVIAEGFPEWEPWQFVDLYCKANGVTSGTLCTKIEFKYL